MAKPFLPESSIDSSEADFSQLIVLTVEISNRFGLVNRLVTAHAADVLYQC